MIPPASWTARPCSLVTGALGFVGLHLVRQLLLAGQVVVGLGKHERGSSLPRRCGGFALAGGEPAVPGAVRYEGPAGWFGYLPLDLADPGPIDDLVRGIRPAMVYHLAAQSSAAASFTDPQGTFTANVQGTVNLLEAVRRAPLAERPVVLSVGSCEEYGRQPESSYPLREDAPLNPLSPYGVSKAAQTLLCRQYVRSYDLPIIPVRSFNHTGPGQDTRFAFPSFARQIAAAEAGEGPRDIRVGNLEAVRDFLDVRDVAAAYRLLIKDGNPGEIYHVSSGIPLTIREGLDILVDQARCPVSVTADPDRQRPSDTPIMVGDSSKLRDITGWVPEWDIRRTLSSMLDEARKEFT